MFNYEHANYWHNLPSDFICDTKLWTREQYTLCLVPARLYIVITYPTWKQLIQSDKAINVIENHLLQKGKRKKKKKTLRFVKCPKSKIQKSQKSKMSKVENLSKKMLENIHVDVSHRKIFEKSKMISSSARIFEVRTSDDFLKKIIFIKEKL